MDDRVFVALERAGYVDLFRLLRPGEHGHTVPGVGRLDYIFATQDRAERATRCDVRQTPETDRASDHYPVLADFELEL